MKATITDIKRFAVHDGDGIRTTVFFKGCPLRCKWCHNPEAFTPKKQLAYFAHKCEGCGCCKKVCPHNMERCDVCGKCEEVCPNDARRVYGKEVTVSELLEVILLDKSFYEASNGGVTLSGGECLLYPEFCVELLKKCKAEGISTAVDTCGYAPLESIRAVLPYTDVFLYDIKAFDEARHIEGTGRSNERILENLRYLNGQGARVEIRIPYIPSYNGDQLEKIADFLKELTCVTRVRLLPYHDFAGSKYEALGLPNTLPKMPLPTKEEAGALEKKYFGK